MNDKENLSSLTQYMMDDRAYLNNEYLVNPLEKSIN